MAKVRSRTTSGPIPYRKPTFSKWSKARLEPLSGSERAEPAACVKCEEKAGRSAKNPRKATAQLNRPLTMSAPNGGGRPAGAERISHARDLPDLPPAV